MSQVFKGQTWCEGKKRDWFGIRKANSPLERSASYWIEKENNCYPIPQYWRQKKKKIFPEEILTIFNIFNSFNIFYLLCFCDQLNVNILSMTVSK